MEKWRRDGFLPRIDFFFIFQKKEHTLKEYIILASILNMNLNASAPPFLARFEYWNIFKFVLFFFFESFYFILFAQTNFA